MRAPRRDRYIAPCADADTGRVVDAALESLRVARSFGRDDPAASLHLLTSLLVEVQGRLAEFVAAARDQGCSWAEVADLLGVTRASAWQRYSDVVADHGGATHGERFGKERQW
ncbi:MAG: hypothetical protein ACRDKD_09315 [Solirubrobacteraceae bacterium]